MNMLLFLREVGEPLVPYGVLLWVARIILLVSVALHIIAAVQLTRMNWTARPADYRTKKSVAATYASRTMRTSGVILAHLRGVSPPALDGRCDRFSTG